MDIRNFIRRKHTLEDTGAYSDDPKRKKCVGGEGNFRKGEGDADESGHDDILGEPEQVSSESDPSFSNLLPATANPLIGVKKSKSVSGPADISHTPDDGPTRLSTLTRHNYVKSRGRRFNPDWYGQYPWIEYSKCEDKVYCFVCRHFSTSQDNETAFTGYNMWKSAQENFQKTNLVIVNAVKSVIPVADLFSTLQLSYNILSGSNVHAGWVQYQKEKYPAEKPIEFKSFSDTRWTSQIRAIDAIKKRFDCFVSFIKYVMSQIIIVSILAQLDQNFIYCMLLLFDILQESMGVSDTLQDSAMDYFRAADLIETLIKEVETYRNDEKAADYYTALVEVAKRNNLTYAESDPEQSAGQKRQRNIPSHMKDFVILSSLGKRNTVHRSGDFKTHILFPTVDKFLNELQRRFSGDQLCILRSLSAFDPSSKEFLDVEIINPIAEHYKLNLNDLSIEIQQAKGMIERGNKIFDSMIEFAEFFNPLNMAFTELYKGLHIALTLPAGTAGCEWTFSKLKLIKSSLRTTMEDSCLKSLIVISVHRQRELDIDLEDVVDKMVGKFPNMRLILV